MAKSTAERSRTYRQGRAAQLQALLAKVDDLEHRVRALETQPKTTVSPEELLRHLGSPPFST